MNVYQEINFISNNTGNLEPIYVHRSNTILKLVLKFIHAQNLCMPFPGQTLFELFAKSTQNNLIEHTKVNCLLLVACLWLTDMYSAGTTEAHQL